MKYPCLLIFSVLMLITACSSPQKLYEKGKYFKSFDATLDKLNNGDKSRKNILLLNKSFDKMMDLSQDRMVYLEDGYEVKDMEINLEEYNEVIFRFVKARSYINEDNNTKYAKFKDQSDLLVDDAYEEGKLLLEYYEQSGNKLDAKIAYLHFNLVYKYGVGYPDIEQLLSKARDYATLVYNVKADLDSDYAYRWDVERKFDNLEGKEGFIQVIYEGSYNLGDCVVELNFSRMNVDERGRTSTQSFTKEIIDGYKTVIDTSGKTIQQPIYVTVSGSVETIAVTKSINWNIDLNIVRASLNCDLREKRFKGVLEKVNEQYRFTGDDRAIPSEYRDAPSSKIPDTDDMVDELIDNLYQDVRRYIYQ